MEGNGWKLILGDCLETLRGMAENAVDIVVTSPPYNQIGNRIPKQATGIHKGDGWIKKVGEIGYSDSKPEPEYQQWLRDVVTECLRVAKGLVWINHKVRYRQCEAIHPARMLPFPIYAEIIWDRGGSMALNCKRYAPSHEVIYGFGNKHYWDDSLNTKMSVWRIGAQRSTDHPCPYPLEIPLRLIQSSCPPDGIVLDPFNGIATTGVADLQLGRRYIGIDNEVKYIDLSRNRIEAWKEAWKGAA